MTSLKSMNMGNNPIELRELAVSLFDIGALKFGDFVTKVGLKTPVYFDLRVIISHPSILSDVSKALWKMAGSAHGIDQICGVPYTALPIATVISVNSGIPMLIRRKEAKAYGTKKLIEGVYKAGQNCVILEDVVTSGSSILETVNDLRKEGLVVKEAFIIVDREQGGKKNVEDSGIKMKSLFTLTQLMHFLFEVGRVSSKELTNVEVYLSKCVAPVKSLEVPEDKTKRLHLDFKARAELCRTKSPLTAKLFEIMAKKETTICLAVDLTEADEILSLANLAGPHIAVLKTHVDIVENFNIGFIHTLQDLSKKHNFLLMEDRKFGDIGNTVSLQYSKSVYKISEWADLVTAHSISGPGILSAFEEALKLNTEPRGIFLITEMSSQGALTNETYAKESVAIGTKSNLVIGHVCQSNIFSDPCLIQMTPGVKLAKDCDKLGQQYNTPESVVNAGADLAVVGRGITEAGDKFSAIIRYKEQLWSAYRRRLSG